MKKYTFTEKKDTRSGFGTKCTAAFEVLNQFFSNRFIHCLRLRVYLQFLVYLINVRTYSI